jgi:hypothetical protein
MGRRETVVYDCDWCKATAPADLGRGHTDFPDGWGYAKDANYTVLCPECHIAQDAALACAKAARRAGIPAQKHAEAIGRTVATEPESDE